MRALWGMKHVGENGMCYAMGRISYLGRGDGSQKRRLAQVIKIPLLILDDFGLQEIDETAQNDLYQLISGRYEKGSIIITSNRDVDEWPRVFKNSLIGTAAVDRLVHRGIRIAIKGPSYRLEEYKRACGQNKKDAIIESKNDETSMRNL